MADFKETDELIKSVGALEPATEIVENSEEARGRSRAKRSRKKPAASAGRDSGQSGDIKDTSKTDVLKGDAKGAGVQAKEKKKGLGKGKIAVMAAGTLAIVLMAGGGTYFAIGQKYKKAFFPNTQINGMDASGKTAEEVKQMISSGIDDYALTIEQRDGKTEQIKKEDINLHSEFDGSLEQLIAAQEPMEWLKHKMNPSSFEIETMIAYDEAALDAQIDKLNCMDETRMVQPENARLSGYVSGQGYSIIPEVMGSKLLPDTVKSGITDAIRNLKETVSLEEIGAYESPAVRKDHGPLMSQRDMMNQYAGVTVTYKFGDKTETLTGERTQEWLVPNEDYSVSVDSAKAAAYVDELAITYDTYNKGKTIKTSYGPTIKVTGGTYGWRINRSAETEALIQVIQSGQSQEREPVYSQKAASRGVNDYGSTYVEINLTAQHLFYYKDGNLIVESDFVSGNLAKGWGTPAGTYPLTYKERNATLKGENYRTPVDYWMPFNGGIGMHDAKWRGTFGGTIYKNGGSHGCVNLPHSVAKKIFENISSGTPVICYNLAGTEKGNGSSSGQNNPAPVPEETQPPAPEVIQPPAPEEVPEPAVPEPTPPVTEAVPAPGEVPTLSQPETTAPAGPGSDNITGEGTGPGSL